MFVVRCAPPRPASQSAVVPSPLHAVRAHRLPPPGPDPAPCNACTTMRDCFTCTAPPPVPVPQSAVASTSLCACCGAQRAVMAAPTAPPRLPACRLLPVHHMAHHMCPSAPACDPPQDAIKFNQPLSWDTSRVTDMGNMFEVHRSPRAPPISPVPPCNNVHAPCTTAGRRALPASCGPRSSARYIPAHCALLASLRSTRGPSTNRSAGTRPASRTCTRCFACAAPPAPCPPNL